MLLMLEMKMMNRILYKMKDNNNKNNNNNKRERKDKNNNNNNNNVRLEIRNNLKIQI